MLYFARASYDGIRFLCKHDAFAPTAVEIIPDREAASWADCRLLRIQKVKECLITAEKVVGVVAAVVGAAYLASQATDDDGTTSYTPLLGGDYNEKGDEKMLLENITDSWMETASEYELRSIESEMRSALESMDYDSDEYLKLDLVRVDLVNAIASGFPLNLPHREHGWYLSNDD